jgi:hypothetical protein
MLDTDLADLYGVTVKRLNEQVKRNVNRSRYLKMKLQTVKFFYGKTCLVYQFTEQAWAEFFMLGNR